jgi:hypothetical protein
MNRLRAAGIVVLLLLPSIYLAWRFARMDHLGVLGDDGTYLVTAKSLAEGRGYRILSLPGEPRQTKFPILFPLALAAVWKVAPPFPDNLPWITLLCWLALPALLALCRVICADFGISGWRSWLLCGMVVWNPAVLLLTLSPMTDVAGACLILGCLILLERAARNGGDARLALAAAVAGAAAYLTRTAALPLVLVGPAVFLMRRQYGKACVFLCGMAPAIAAWAWWTRGAVSPLADYPRAFYLDYVSVFRFNVTWTSVADIVVANASQLFGAIGGLFFLMPDGSPYLRVAGLAVLLGLLLWIEKKGATSYNLFVAAYCALLLVQPQTPNERFIVPVLPLLLAACLAQRWSPAVPASMAAVLAVLCVSGVSGPRFLAGYLQGQETTGYDVQRACAWIRGHLPPDAGFVSAYDGLIYLHTGRHALSYQIPPVLVYRDDQAGARRALEDLPRYARRNGLDYVLATGSHPGASLPDALQPIGMEVIEKNADPIFRAGEVGIYRLRAARAAPTSQ